MMRRYNMTYEEIESLSPAKFEKLVVLVLQKLEYETTHISLANDIGIDIIAKKSHETIAVQVKKYENRRINLAMIYHTYGAAAYYGCSKAVIITLSELTSKAEQVAKKLNVEIWGRATLLNHVASLSLTSKSLLENMGATETEWFYYIWNTHIKRLQGQGVRHIAHNTYITVLKVNDDCMTVANSNGNEREFDISIFRQVLARFKSEGRITRKQINEDYQRRGSSAICAVIATIPGVEKAEGVRQSTLIWNVGE